MDEAIAFKLSQMLCEHPLRSVRNESSKFIEAFRSMHEMIQDDPAPNLGRSEICGYPIPEGGKGSCKRFKRPIQQSLSVKPSNLPRPVESRSPKSPASWASPTPQSINGVKR